MLAKEQLLICEPCCDPPPPPLTHTNVLPTTAHVAQRRSLLMTTWRTEMASRLFRLLASGHLTRIRGPRRFRRRPQSCCADAASNSWKPLLVEAIGPGQRAANLPALQAAAGSTRSSSAHTLHTFRTTVSACRGPVTQKDKGQEKNEARMLTGFANHQRTDTCARACCSLLPCLPQLERGGNLQSVSVFERGLFALPLTPPGLHGNAVGLG